MGKREGRLCEKHEDPRNDDSKAISRQSAARNKVAI